TVRSRWFDFPRTLGLMVLPAATVAIGLWVWLTLGKSDSKPFAGAVAIFVLAFMGLAYSLFPYVVMDKLTIWDAAADDSALRFVGVGLVFVLPFILAWQIYSPRVFRGKVRQGIYRGKREASLFHSFLLSCRRNRLREQAFKSMTARNYFPMG